MNDVLNNKVLKIELGAHFKYHFTALNDAIMPAQLDLLWQDIALRYQEAQRAYHTLDHIQQLINQFEQIKHFLHEPHIIALSIFYHDVIYEPTRSDNELQSANHAVTKLSHYLDNGQCQRIYALIMMTATHQIEIWAEDNKDSDAAFLLDMDLSVLGASWPEYEQYMQAVRQEYRHIASAEYRGGRTAVLEELLAHQQLYLTEHYHEQLEKQACDNINREISLLRAS